jgi:oligoribonuclease NrnB/cAMP/cGMP phosphodiesterase (DHH superfamily)
MKTVCVYHSIDLDGQMSAAIVKRWFIKNYRSVNSSLEQNDEIVIENLDKFPVEVHTLSFIGYNYGQPIPDLSDYDKVIICDISFPKEEMLKIFNQVGLGNFIWLDHHISAIKSNISVEANGIRNTKFAACELTWQYFFPNETMPEIVRLLGRYDCFGHKNTDEETKVLQFQYGARQCISNYEEAYGYLCNSINKRVYKEGDFYKWYIEDIIHEDGESIYRYLCTEAKQVYKNGFEIELGVKYCGGIDPIDENSKVQIFTKGFKFICINKERFNPINFGIDYHKDGYDGAACFYFDGTNYNFSLYNDNGLVDCSAIAKQYGGGGHAGASGFILTPEQFNNLIAK